jgi:hypothetical protein
VGADRQVHHDHDGQRPQSGVADREAVDGREHEAGEDARDERVQGEAPGADGGHVRHGSDLTSARRVAFLSW